MAPPGARTAGRLGAALRAVLVAGFAAALLAGLVATPADAATTTTTTATTEVPGPVVVVGIPGLSWQDVTREDTPNLWRLTGHGAAGSMSARVDARLTCPTEGWLTLSAGSRALAPIQAETAGPTPSPTPTPTAGVDQEVTRCESIPFTRPLGGTGDRIVDGWAPYRDQNASGQYRTRLGELPRVLAAHGRCLGAVGPGALVASAGSDGLVTRHRGGLRDLAAIARACPITFVDPGATIGPRRADQRLGEIRDRLPRDATLVVLGISDASGYAQMHVAIADGPAAGGSAYRGRWLGSPSTRRDDLLQLTDVTPTLLRLVGLDPDASDQFVGTPLRAGPAYDMSTADVVDRLDAVDRANRVSRRLTPYVSYALQALQLLIYGLAAYALRRRAPTAGLRRRRLRRARLVALAVASVPTGTFLANLVPWAASARSTSVLLLACVLFSAVVFAIALAGPWRRHPLGPPTVVVGASAVVLGADVLTGSHLQLSSVLGYPAVIGARFYGFGNIMFALFATGVLLLLAGLYAWLRPRTGSRPALLAVALLGLAAVALDGWPAWGSDFGGVIAFVPGVLVLVLSLAGRRVHVRWLAAVCLAGVVAIAAIAYLDYRRPPEARSHLGRFVAQLLAGDAWPVLARKLGANLHILLTSWSMTLLVAVGIAYVVLVLRRPQGPDAPLARAYAAAPVVRSGLLAVLVMLVVGAVLNDSGIAIPAVGGMLALPYATAVCLAVAPDEPPPAAQPAPTDEPSSVRT